MSNDLYGLKVRLQHLAAALREGNMAGGCAQATLSVFATEATNIAGGLEALLAEDRKRGDVAGIVTSGSQILVKE